MDEFFTPEQKKFLSTPEGKKILEIALERASSEDVPEDPDNFQERETDFIRDALKMRTDSGGDQPMTVDPEFVPDIPDSIAKEESDISSFGIGARGLDTPAERRFNNDLRRGKLEGSEAFPLIESLGIGARGLETPAEREERMKKALTGRY